MKKFKKIMLGALSVLTLGLFVVTGTKVNAADSINYGEEGVSKAAATTTAGNTYNLNAYYGSSSDTNADYGVYHLNFSSINFDAGSNVTQHEDLTAYLKTSSETSSGYGWRAKSSTGCNIQIKIGAQQSATIIIYLYYNSTNNGVNIDGTTYTTTNSSKVVDKVVKNYVNDTDSTYTYTIAPGNKSGITYISTTTTALSTDGVSVHFESNGGSNVDTQTVKSGEKATRPSNPTKANYTFVNWYTKDGSNDDWGDVFDFDNTISESITLYAKWTENAKYNVTYYVDGVQLTNVDAKYTSVYTGSSLEYYPTYTDKAFDGWYTNTNYSVKVTAVTGNISLYGRTTELKTSLTQSDLTAETLSETKVHYAGTMFTLTSGLKIGTDAKTLPNETTSSYRINTSGSSYNSSTNIRTIDFTAPSDGKVVVYANTNSANKHVNLYNPSTQDVLSSYTTAEAAIVYEIEFEVEKDNEYALGIDTNGSFYYVAFVENASVSFNCQYDTEDPADATKIRFIATIDGVADVTAINTVTFSITVGTQTEYFKCSKLYSSIANVYDNFGSADGRYYAVYALTGIQSAIQNGVAFESMSVTVTFTSESGLAAVTANHTGFTLGTLGE